MTLTQQIEKIRTDDTLTEHQRVWNALTVLAQHIDDGDSADVLSAIFGS